MDSILYCSLSPSTFIQVAPGCITEWFEKWKNISSEAIYNFSLLDTASQTIQLRPPSPLCLLASMRQYKCVPLNARLSSRALWSNGYAEVQCLYLQWCDVHSMSGSSPNNIRVNISRGNLPPVIPRPSRFTAAPVLPSGLPLQQFCFIGMLRSVMWWWAATQVLVKYAFRVRIQVQWCPFERIILSWISAAPRLASMTKPLQPKFFCRLHICDAVANYKWMGDITIRG